MIKAIITDVEGTTTSISFVHQTLFPFAKERLKSFVLANLENEVVRDCLYKTKETAMVEDQLYIDDNNAIELLLKWIQEDRKHPALKTLQGLIWDIGYNSGEIKGHVYPEVKDVLSKWKQQGLLLGVYSSGSVKAQHLIFKHSIAGDLKQYFSAFFDTNIGHKREVTSYQNIAKELSLPPQSILFLSDIKEELDAAQEAGLKTIQLVRQDDVVIGNHPTATNFSEIKV